jgi:hypothetical protein
MSNQRREFINDTSQAERRAALANDRRVSTYHQFKLPEEELGGRYRKLEPQTIVGSDNPIPSYTRAAPWSATQLPDEPPLGWSVEDQMPVGEPHEVEASLGDGSTFPTSVADDATDRMVASSEEPAPAPRSPVGVADGNAPDITVEPSARSNNFRRRI